MSKLNKSDLNRLIAEKHGLSERQAGAILDDFLAEVIAGVANHGEVDLHDFGTFELRTRKARKGRNPRTGESIGLPESKYAGFRAFKRFKDALN